MRIVYFEGEQSGSSPGCSASDQMQRVLLCGNSAGLRYSYNGVTDQVVDRVERAVLRLWLLSGNQLVRIVQRGICGRNRLA